MPIANQLPIACTLTPETIRTRRAALLSGLVARAEVRQDLPNGFRARFASASDVLATVLQTVEAERHCCKFLKFQVTVDPDDGPIWLEVTGPDGTADFLAALLDT
jgi:hypothetical protein